jgi:type I restriction enzyme S subunit
VKAVRLADVCSISAGLVDPRLPRFHNLLHVGGANIESDTGALRDLLTAKSEGLTSGKFFFDKTAVLYSKIRPYLKKVATPDFDGLCSADIYPLSPREAIDRRYLFYLLLSDNFTRYAIQGSARAGMPKVNRDHLFAYEFELPKLTEQRRIVRILDEAFAAIATARANTEKNLQNACELFESQITLIFESRDQNWDVTTLDRLATNLDSRRVPITKNARSAGPYPYYGASGIVDYVADYIFDEESLLVSEDGANLLMRSSPIAFSATGKYWVNNHAHVLSFREKATQRFVEFYLESIPIDDFVTGAAQPKLNQKALNSIPIPIPRSIELRSAIVERIESISTETASLESLYAQKLTALDALKQSLLHHAFTGQL